MKIPIHVFLTIFCFYNSAIYAIIGYTLNLEYTVLFAIALGVFGAIPAAFSLNWYIEVTT
jgi:hypothetical protein